MTNRTKQIENIFCTEKDGYLLDGRDTEEGKKRWICYQVNRDGLLLDIVKKILASS